MEIARRNENVFSSLQAGRAIAAIFVVLFHCEDTIAKQKYWHTSWKWLYAFGHSGVEIFFVLSGVVLLHAHFKDLGRPEKLRHYVWKRFRRVYPLYWLVLAMILPVFLAMPSFGFGYERQPRVILESIFLLHITQVNTVVFVAWTLYHEILFYLVFGLCLLSKRIGVGVFLLWMLVSLLSLVHPPLNPVLATYTSPLHLLFGFGFAITLLVGRIRLPGLPLAAIGVAAFIGCCLYENHQQTQSDMLNIAYGLAAAISIGGFMLLEKENRVRVPRALSFLGDASYSIYLIHYPVISAMAKMLYTFSKRHVIPVAVPFSLMAVTALGIGSLMHLGLEVPLLRILGKRRVM